MSLVDQYLRSPPSSFKTMSVELILISIFLTVVLLLVASGSLRFSYQVYAWAKWPCYCHPLG
jgi:hypothetical protein